MDLCRRHQDLSTHSNHHILQNDLDTFMEWNRTWQGFVSVSISQ